MTAPAGLVNAKLDLPPAYDVACLHVAVPAADDDRLAQVRSMHFKIRNNLNKLSLLKCSVQYPINNLCWCHNFSSIPANDQIENITLVPHYKFIFIKKIPYAMSSIQAEPLPAKVPIDVKEEEEA